MPVKKKGKIYMKKKSRIPKFKTYEEEANFWDTHDVTDYWDETEDVEIVFAKDLKMVYRETKKPRDETLVLRMQKKFKDKLQEIARSKGLNVSTLARMWLMEKLQASRS